MNKFLYIIVFLCFSITGFAQEKKNISQMTKEDVLVLTFDELLDLPFEDVLKLADIIGVSLDELYEMILNKDVVSASKKMESCFEAPLSTDVISHDEIISSGARSVEEALRLVPGMIVREKTNGNFDIHIRGNDNLPPNHMFVYSENSITLVMIDSRPVYNYVHGGTFWETLPIGIEDIERIEVVHGPSSALYGPNAVSGVVNIITTKQIGTKPLLTANIQGGTQNTLISSLAIGKGITRKLAFRLTGNFETMNRNTDLLYVHKANNGNGTFISKEELAVLPDYTSEPVDLAGYRGNRNLLVQVPGDTNYYFRVFDPHDNINEMYPNPRLSRQRYGVNGYAFYNLSKDINIDIKGGYQYSNVLSTTMGDNPTSLMGRLSNTMYTDINAKVHGLRTQVNYLTGWQDIVKSDTGFKTKIFNINSNTEYDFQFRNLNIRPGFSYQVGIYDDRPFLKSEGQGFLNGQKKLTSTAISLRTDYLVFKKFRLIGALRGEKYNTNTKIYLSYQFIGALNFSNKQLIRAVYSRANRGPFLVDSYANFLWEREARPIPGYILFKGKESLDLLTMDMIEIGYRIKPAKNIQASFEFFYNKSKNFGALYPDSVNLNGAQFGIDRPWVHMQYRNIDLISQQFGFTGSISWVTKQDWVFKVFGTCQLTNLKNVITYSPDEITSLMLLDASMNTTDFSSVNFPTNRESIKNHNTPTYYGGVNIDYTFKEKWKVNMNSYFYSTNELQSKYGIKTIDAKLILNAKVSYSIYKKADVYLNVRNILGAKTEFAYMDEIGTLAMLGCSLSL